MVGLSPVGVEATQEVVPMQILLIGNESALTLGGASILESENEFAVRKIKLGTDGSLPQVLEQSLPDLVILEVGPNTPLPTLRSQLLERFPFLPVIIVNSLDNKINLYDHDEILIKESAELLTIVRDIQARKEGNKRKQ